MTKSALALGTQHLSAVDPDLGAVVARLGVPPMWGRRPGFPTLIQIILEQQVSLAAARTMYRRLHDTLGDITPKSVHAFQISGLRDFGLTRQKAAYCHGLAERILAGDLNLATVARSADEQGRQLLLAVPGIGPWSVDIYYLMALRRPDIWPQGDLALAISLAAIKRLDERPTSDQQRLLANDWTPWRSVAARIIWAHYLDARGQYQPRPKAKQDDDI
ncbi:MAG: DNA-3-methyladenine glycosylase 2 family protein [Candidatus Latescibacteria bacterium]|nr:DNA-3-methyladenine glycosylase 2 family protein [Candidatus Latescibacterota bacterium]